MSRWWVHRVVDNNRQPWRNSRLFLNDRIDRVDASLEWCLFHRGILAKVVGFKFGRNGQESDVGLDVNLGPLGSFYLRLRAPWLSWLRITDKQDPDHWYLARHYGFRVSVVSPLVQIDCGAREGYWSISDPWWREITVSSDHILGRCIREVIVVDQGDMIVPLPEGNYQAKFVQYWYKAQHARFPGTWLDRLVGADRPPKDPFYEIEVEGGIPHYGKGENSWDCGMSGTYGISGSFRTLEDAVAAMLRSVLISRARNGGPHDMPNPMSIKEAIERYKTV